MAKNPFDSGGGSGSTSTKNPFGSGGGGGGTRKKKASPSPVNRQLVQVASRLARAAKKAPPDQRDRIMLELGRNLQGLSSKKVSKIGTEAGLYPEDIDALQSASQYHGSNPIAPALDIIDRPAQAIKGGLVEARSDQFNPLAGAKGALRGLTGKEKYSGVQAIAAIAGQKKEQGKKIEESLPGPVRFAGNVAADVVFDPTNYLTLGSTSLADDAARTVAKAVAGQSAADAALSAPARDVYQNILAKGAKALSDAERKQLPRNIIRKLNRATGGVRVAGKQFPGTRGLLRGAGVKNPEKLLSGLERDVRPRASLRQAVRRGDVAPSTVQDVENIQAQVRGQEFLGSLGPRRAERGASAAAGEALGKTSLSRAAIRAGEKIIDDPAALDRIRNSLDVGGGAAARAGLPKGEREFADFLRSMSDEDFQALQSVGRLRSDAQMVAQHRQQDLFGENIDLQDPVLQDQYLMHLRKKEDRPSPYEVKAQSGVPAGQQPFLKTRTNREAIGGVEGYEQNPVVSMGAHAKGTAREVGSVKAWQDLGTLGTPEGTPLAALDRGAQDAVKAAHPDNWESLYEEMRVPVTRESGQTSNETVLVHKDVAPFFQKVLKSQGDKTLRRNVEYLNALWARWATGTTGFISRNVLQGNLYMGMVLAEARDPRVWARQLGTMKRLQSGIVRLGDPYALLKPEEVALVKGAMENNAVESGFLDTIKSQSEEALKGAGKVGKVLKGSRGSPVSTNFLPIERVSAANQWAENWSRLSVYANKIKQGYAPPEAAAIARKYLLDYKDLAPLNEAARIVNPFLTWTYKSTPLILGTLAKDPRKVKIPLTILNALNEEGVQSEGAGISPQWQTEGGGVLLPKAIREKLPLGLDKSPQVFMPASPIHTTLEATQPALDVMDIVRRQPGSGTKFAEDLINLVGPGGVVGGTAKSVAEAAAGKQFFSGRKFQEGQRVPTPKALRRIFGETMPWEQYNALSNVLPGMSRLATVFPSSPYEKAAQPRRIVSQIGGVTLAARDEAAQTSELYRRLDALNALITDLRGRGQKVPHRTRTVKKSGNPFG